VNGSSVSFSVCHQLTLPASLRSFGESAMSTALRESIKIYALCYYTPKKIRPVLNAVFPKNAVWAYILAKNRAFI
jgi:hypothetical protein